MPMNDGTKFLDTYGTIDEPPRGPDNPHFVHFQPYDPYILDGNVKKPRHELHIWPECMNGRHDHVGTACECPCHIPGLTLLKVAHDVGGIL